MEKRRLHIFIFNYKDLKNVTLDQYKIDLCQMQNEWKQNKTKATKPKAYVDGGRT
jgi:hypothetical protein